MQHLILNITVVLKRIHLFRRYEEMASRLIITNSCIILILGLFSIDLYNPALPTIKAALNISNAQAQSLVVWYLGGFAVSQLVYGPLSDKYGRVPVILLSLFFSAVGNYLTSKEAR